MKHYSSIIILLLSISLHSSCVNKKSIADNQSLTNDIQPTKPTIETTKSKKEQTSKSRSFTQLITEIQGFESALQKMALTEYPLIADSGFVQPPTWNELQPLLERKTDLKQRLSNTLLTESVLRKILIAYTAKTMSEVQESPTTAKDSAEGISYGVSLLNFWAVAMPLFYDELLPTLDPKDDNYPTQIDGLKKIQIGVTGIIQGLLITINARRITIPNRIIIANTLKDRSPVFSRLLIAEYKNQINVWLTQVIAEEKNSIIKTALNQCLTYMRKQ